MTDNENLIAEARRRVKEDGAYALAVVSRGLMADLSDALEESEGKSLKLVEWGREDRKKLNHIEAVLEDYAHDSGASHRVVREIADVIGVELFDD